jgi:hypothetical protein
MTTPALTFVVCVNDEEVLQKNLLASPDLRPGTPHVIIALRKAPSAADGLNAGIKLAKTAYVVCLHQDVFLPKGWVDRMWAQLQEAEERFGPVGVAGVYGACYAPEHPRMPNLAGHVIDRGEELHEPHALPARVETLDELLLIVPRAAPWRFDSRLGWHLYGADFACQVRNDGAVAVVLDAPCHHNSRMPLNAEEPASFRESGEYFRQKWRYILPIVTPCVVMEDPEAQPK